MTSCRPPAISLRLVLVLGPLATHKFRFVFRVQQCCLRVPPRDGHSLLSPRLMEVRRFPWAEIVELEARIRHPQQTLDSRAGREDVSDAALGGSKTDGRRALLSCSRIKSKASYQGQRELGKSSPPSSPEPEHRREIANSPLHRPSIFALPEKSSFDPHIILSYVGHPRRAMGPDADVYRADNNTSSSNNVEPDLDEDPAPTPPAAPANAHQLIKCCKCGGLVNTDISTRCANVDSGNNQCQHDVDDCCSTA